MSDISLGGLGFDRGIDRITYARQDAGSRLPERGDSAPAELAQRPQVETLLAMTTLDDTLDAALRPQLENRELLSPTQFRGALDSALQHLRESAEARAGLTDADATESTRVLNRATRLLNEESGLRDLVQMYRSALYQG